MAGEVLGGKDRNVYIEEFYYLLAASKQEMQTPFRREVSLKR